MFSNLIEIVNLTKTAVEKIRKFKSDSERKEAVLGLLKTYFLLKD